MNAESKLKILIVEDDSDLRQILALQLSGEGFDVSEASDGAEAFSRLQQSTYDCVILDLMMPIMDGFTLLKRMRTVNRTTAIPVLILTASEDEYHRHRSEQYQADAYLQKPYDLQDLMAMIRELCTQATP